ncbi:MAG: hypothetical protein LBS64_02450, partial [Spirochaetaceae bacterium]|nr:hypothetical protein [Spirochaetaceae bacterium]
MFDAGDVWEYYDELEVELLKAKAVAKYWQDELDIASALEDYAVNASSSKEIGAETREALRRAEDEYRRALESYRNEITRLDQLYGETGLAREAVDQTAQQLASLRQDMEEKRESHNAALAALRGIDGDLVKARVLNVLESLHALWEGGENRYAPWEALYSAAQGYAGTEQELVVDELLQSLFNGDESGNLSIAEVRDNREKWRRIAEADPDIQRASLDSIPGALSEIRQLLEEQYALQDMDPQDEDGAPTGDEAPPEDSTAADRQAQAEEIIRQCWERVAAYWEDELARRQGAANYLVIGDTGLEGDRYREIREHIQAVYGEYAYGTVNAAHNRAKTEVHRLMAATDLSSFTKNGAAGVSQFWGYIDSLEDAGQGLNAGGRVVLEQYIGDVIEYLGAYLFNTLTEEEKADIPSAPDIQPVERAYTAWLLYRQGMENPDEASRRELAQREREYKRAQYEYLLAQHLINQRDSSSVDWRSALARYDLGSLAGISENQQHALDSLVGQDGFAFYAAAAQRKLSEQGAYFGEPDPALTFSPEPGEDWYYHYQGIEQNTDDVLGALLDAMAMLENRAALGKTLENEIYSHLQTLKMINEEAGDLRALADAAYQTFIQAESRYRDRGWGDFNAAVSALEAKCVQYNAQLKKSDRAFEEAEQAKLEARKRQKIFDWASGVYLEGFGVNSSAAWKTPTEILSETRYAQERAVIALEVLEDMRGNGSQEAARSGRDTAYLAALGDYKTAVRNYYTGRAIAYEAAREIGRMENVVREAEWADQAALAALVRDILPESLLSDGTVKTANTHLDMIRLVRDENTGTYTVRLAWNIQIASELFEQTGTAVPEAGLASQDTAVIDDYFTQKTDLFKLVDYRENKKTKAAAEGIAWLSGIAQKEPSYLGDLGLAFLYLQMLGSEQNKAWFLDTESTPRDNDAYALAEVPDQSIHGINPIQAYYHARMAVLMDAWISVTGTAEGREDLARYILYRDTSLTIKCAQREQTEMKTRAVKIVSDKLTARVNDYAKKERASFATAAACFAAACIPFAPTGALIAAGVAATVLGVDFGLKKRDLSDVRSAVNDVFIGHMTNGDDQNKREGDSFDKWLEIRADFQEKRDTLDRYYGERAPGETELRMNSFLASLTEILDNAAGSVTGAEMRGKYTETLFASSGTKNALGTVDAIGKLNGHLQMAEAKKLTALNEDHLQMLEDAQEAGMNAFYGALSQAMEIPLAEKEQLRRLALAAGDVTASVEARNAARAQYNVLEARLAWSYKADFRQELTHLAEQAMGSGSWYQKQHDLALLNLQRELATSRITPTRGAETHTLDALGAFKNALLDALNHAQEACRQVKQTQWALVQKDFHSQYQDWTYQMNIILEKS